LKSGDRAAVSIIGGSLWGNRGAEAMVVTCVGETLKRWPDASVHVFSYFPSQDRRLLGARQQIGIHDARPIALVFRLLPFAIACKALSLIGLRVPDGALPKDISALRASSVLLDVSGISFSDGRELYLLHNVFAILPALLLDVPVFKVSQALGPFNGPINRAVSRLLLPRCTYIVARGKSTATHLMSLNLPTTLWGRHSDSAFAYETAYSLTNEGAEIVERFDRWQVLNPRPGRKIVGVCPSSVVYAKSVAARTNYIKSLSVIVAWALRAGHRVAIIPNATRQDNDTLRNNDLPVIRMLREQIERDAPDALPHDLFWVETDINTARLRNLISRFDILITSRFHAMIAALSQEIPTVVIGWSHKYKEVLADFSLEDCCFDFSFEDLGMIQSRISAILDPTFRLEWPPSGRTMEVIQSAKAQFDLALGPGKSSRDPYDVTDLTS
jgi:polysaccharide pyruvyl transferase WcaK-like protein